jgi:hypothetical protein
MRAVVVIFILSSIFSGVQALASEYSSSFNRQSEFPSYLSEGSSTERAAIKREVEEILQKRFNNMTIPVPKGDNGYERVKFMDWARSEAQQLGIADRIKFYPSGGLIRNNVTEVYEQVYAEKARNPKKPVVDILRDIKARTPNEIFHTQIRGVGSDFDVLIGGLNEDELKKFNSTLETKITKFEKSSGLMAANKSGAGALKKSFLVVPDFKDVTAQITRATGQGGFEGDFLFFDMQEGRLKDPPQLGRAALTESPYLQKYAGAGDRLFSGKIQYHSPYNLDVVRLGDTDAQTVRALRTLSEAPWSSVEDLNGAFVSEMRQAIQKGNLSPKAQEQLTKMVRNSRFGGGANRFTRLPESASEAEKLIYEFREKYPDQFRSFLARSTSSELGAKFADAPEGLRKALMPSSGLPSTLYHGVPSVDVLPSVARNGLILSTTQVEDKTTAVFGDGAYSSENYATAKGYARDNGIVIPIHLEKDAKVIDWSKVDSTTRKVLEAEAAAKNVPLNLYLHDKYGVQAIKNSHFLILDMAAVENPVKNYSDILKFYAQNIKELPASQRRFTDIASTLQIAKYAEMSGEPGVENILRGSKSERGALNWEKMLAESFGRNPVDDLTALSTFDVNDFSSTTVSRIRQSIQTPAFKRALAKEIWTDPKQTVRLLRSLTADSSTEGLSAARQQIANATNSQLRAVLNEGGRLRTEISRNPMAFAELTTDRRISPAIKDSIRSTFASLENLKSIESSLVAQLKTDAEKGFFSKWAILNELPESMSKKIFDQLPYSQKAFERLNYRAFENGKITTIGRLLMDKDPAAMKREISASPYRLRGLSSDDFDYLKSKGVPQRDLNKAVGTLIADGELTPSAKWAISNSSADSLPQIRQYEIGKLKKGSDVSILMEAGYPRELIVAAPESALRDMGAKVRQYPDGTKSVAFSNNDVYRSQSKVRPLFEPSFDLEKLLKDANGDTQKLAEIRASLREQFDFQKRLRDAAGDRQKISEIQAAYKEEFAKFISKPNVPNQLQGALVSKDETIRKFAEDLLRDNADMRSSTAKASLVARRKDVFDAIPFNLDDPEDQKLFKELGGIKAQGSRGIIATHANQLRASGNAKPSGGQIGEAIRESSKAGQLELAKAMEELKVSLPTPTKPDPGTSGRATTSPTEAGRPNVRTAAAPSKVQAGCVTKALEALVKSGRD